MLILLPILILCFFFFLQLELKSREPSDHAHIPGNKLFFPFYLFIYLRVHWVSLLCTGFFSSYHERGLLLRASNWGGWPSHCGGFSCCWAQTLRHAGFSSCNSWAQWLWQRGLVAPRQVKSSQILIHFTIREVPIFFPFKRKIPLQVPLSWFSKACHSVYKSLHGLAMDKHYVLNNSGMITCDQELIFPSRGHLAMSGDVLSCHTCGE